MSLLFRTSTHILLPVNSIIEIYAIPYETEVRVFFVSSKGKKKKNPKISFILRVQKFFQKRKKSNKKDLLSVAKIHRFNFLFLVWKFSESPYMDQQIIFKIKMDSILKNLDTFSLFTKCTLVLINAINYVLRMGP